MKKIVELLPLLLIIFFPCLGLYIGMEIGSFRDENKQKYEPWKQIESPYKFKEIVDATSDTVWVKTIDGKLYSWEMYCDHDMECEKWVETQEVPADIHEGYAAQQFEKNNFCPLSRSSLPKEPPSTVKECGVGSYMSIVWIAQYYALLDDGTIWYWKYPVGNDSVGWTEIYSLGGIFAGFAIALLAFVIFSTIGQNYSDLFALLIAFSIFGTIISVVIRSIILYLQISGVLIFWTSIESPYKFSEITNANTERIWAKSKNGQLYMWDCEYQKDCIWVEINYEPDYLTINELNRDDLPFRKDTTCHPNNYFRLIQKPTQNIVECVFVWKSDLFLGHRHGKYIALLDDGTISSLQYSNKVKPSSLLINIRYGLGMGLVVFIYSWIKKNMKQN